MSEAIHATTAAQKKTIDTDFPSDATRVGVDDEGATHYYSRIRQTMFVIAADRSVETHDVTPGKRFNAWLSFIEQERGWTSHNVSKDVGALICERVTVNQEAA